jgi:hypothetical protein
MATLRAALWYPPPDTNPPDANEPREKRKSPKKNGPAGSFRPPPGFADVVLAALADAEVRPARCREYFQVLSALLRRRDEDDERCLETDKEEERVANAKLDVAASALFAREVEALRVAPREMDKEEEPDPRLLSRLETLLALLERLDRRRAAPAARAEVDGAVTRLARTLLYRCLFPEAAPLLRPAEATLLDAGVELCGGATEANEETREKETSAEDDPEDASFAARFGLRIADVRVTEAHLAPACATPATRRAAFALLARLAARRAAAEDFAAAGDFGARFGATFGADVAGEAAALAAPCGEEILDTVAALHHSGAIDSDFAVVFATLRRRGAPRARLRRAEKRGRDVLHERRVPADVRDAGAPGRDPRRARLARGARGLGAGAAARDVRGARAEPAGGLRAARVLARVQGLRRRARERARAPGRAGVLRAAAGPGGRRVRESRRRERRRL